MMFKKYREERAKDKKMFADIARSETEYYKAKSKEHLTRLVNEMVASPCAVRDMDNCSNACVHFQTGKTTPTNFGYWLVKPRCKLWGGDPETGKHYD